MKIHMYYHNKWRAVRKEGGKRASAVFKSRVLAIIYGYELMKKANAIYYIHFKNGLVEEKLEWHHT